MEITKQNESFTLKDNTTQFEMSGSASREVSGSINIHFSVNKVGGEHVGDGHYNKYGETGSISFGVNCSESDRDELTAYADSVIDAVLAHFQTV